MTNEEVEEFESLINPNIAQVLAVPDNIEYFTNQEIRSNSPNHSHYGDQTP
jgi:hypothetical protein